MASNRIGTDVNGFVGSTSIHRIGGKFYMVISYAENTQVLDRVLDRVSIETLAYESDERGNILNSVPVLASKKIEDHDRFLERLQ